MEARKRAVCAVEDSSKATKCTTSLYLITVTETVSESYPSRPVPWVLRNGQNCTLDCLFTPGHATEENGLPAERQSTLLCGAKVERKYKNNSHGSVALLTSSKSWCREVLTGSGGCSRVSTAVRGKRSATILFTSAHFPAYTTLVALSFHSPVE